LKALETLVQGATGVREKGELVLGDFF